MEALEAMARPSTYFAAVLVMGLLPGLVLRLLLCLYPKGHPRRTELLAELYALPWWERPFFVAQVIEVAFCEGFPRRLGEAVRALRARGQRYLDKMALALEQPSAKPGRPLIKLACLALTLIGSVDAAINVGRTAIFHVEEKGWPAWHLTLSAGVALSIVSTALIRWHRSDLETLRKRGQVDGQGREAAD